MRQDDNAQRSEEEVVAEESNFAENDSAAGADTAVDDNMAGEEVKNDAESEKMADVAMEWRDKYMRLSAEFDNFRKRTLREKMELMSTASEDVIRVLLPVVDDFDRALEASRAASDVNAVREGVELIAGKLRSALRGKGVTEVESLGMELDTDFHEAVAKIPADKKSRGRIVDVVQKGYKLGDKVIRHAKVVVGE